MSTSRRKNIIVLLIGSVISCLAGLVNGFPFMYPDVGTYMMSGFEGVVPFDRPIFYGLFIRHVSLMTSLWLVVYVQSLILSWLVYKLINIFFKGDRGIFLYLTSLLFLSIFTGYSVTISHVLPDVFSPIGFLALILLLIKKNTSVGETIALSLIFVFSCVLHLSNIPSFVLVVLLCATLKKIYSTSFTLISWRRTLLASSLLILSLLVIPSVNKAFGDEFSISRGSHVFMMNHLIETGVVDDYLKEKCPTEPLCLCGHEGKMKWNFIWAEDSPFYTVCGGWRGSKEEFDYIINDIYTSPKYWDELGIRAIENTAVQWFSFETKVEGSQLTGTSAFVHLNTYFPRSIIPYTYSKQSLNTYDVEWIVPIERIVILFSLLSLIIFMILRQLRNALSSDLRAMVILFLGYSLINALVTSNLSTVASRFQNRIIWIAPLLFIIVMIKTRHIWMKKLKKYIES